MSKKEQEDNDDDGSSGTDGTDGLVAGFSGPHESGWSLFNEDGSFNRQSISEFFKGVAPSWMGGTGEKFVAHDKVERVMGAIASLESGGNRTGCIRYDAIGPECSSHKTGRFSSKVDGHALGGWQVMAENVPEWGRQAGYKNLTPEEFLGDKEIQKQVVEVQVKKLLGEGYSVEDVASIWQSGRPLAQAMAHGAHDQNINTQTYAARVQKHFDALINAPQEAASPDRKGLSTQQAENTPAPTTSNNKKPLEQAKAGASAPHESLVS